MNLKKKIGKVFTSKFVGTGPSSYEKRIYRAAVSQRLRNTDVDECKRFQPRATCKGDTNRYVNLVYLFIQVKVNLSLSMPRNHRGRVEV